MLVTLLERSDIPEWKALGGTGGEEDSENRRLFRFEVRQYYRLFGMVDCEYLETKWGMGLSGYAAHVCGTEECDCGVFVPPPEEEVREGEDSDDSSIQAVDREWWELDREVSDEEGAGLEKEMGIKETECMPLSVSSSS